MKRATLILAIIFLTGAALLTSSCNILPMEVTRADGTHVKSMGATLFTKNSGKHVKFTSPDGSSIEYSTATEDETVVPKAVGTAYAAAVASNVLGDVYKSKEVTNRAALNSATARNASNNATKQAISVDNNATKVKLAAPEEVAGAVPAPQQ